MNSRIHSSAIVEPLESRQLFAATDLSALFGGSLLFARKDGAVNRLHASIHVDAESDGGALSGHIDIDGLGNFRFNGSANNSLVFLVFDGANGSGNLVASETSDGALSGEMTGTIGGVDTKGSVRLHSDGGTPGSSVATDEFATTSSAVSGSFNSSAIAGNYGGSVIFPGTAPLETAGSARHRVHAVLNLNTNTADPSLLTGNFRMDHVGKYQITGSTVGDQTVLIFTGGTGSGGMVLTTGGTLPGSNPLLPIGSATSSSGSVINLTGKLFGTIDDIDVHARATFHNSAALNSVVATGAPSLDFGGPGAPVTPSILNGNATAAAAAATTNNNTTSLITDTTTPNFINMTTPNFANSGSNTATNLDNTMSSQLVDSITPPSSMFNDVGMIMG